MFVSVCFISARGRYRAQWNARINVGTDFSRYRSYSDEVSCRQMNPFLLVLGSTSCPVSLDASVVLQGSNCQTTSNWFIKPNSLWHVISKPVSLGILWLNSFWKKRYGFRLKIIIIMEVTPPPILKFLVLGGYL